MTPKEKKYLAIGAGVVGVAVVAAMVANAGRRPTPSLPPPTNWESVRRRAAAATFVTLMTGPLALTVVPYALAYPEIMRIAGMIANGTISTAGDITVESAREIIKGVGAGFLRNPLSSAIGWTLVLGAVGGAIWFFAPVAKRKALNYRSGLP